MIAIKDLPGLLKENPVSVIFGFVAVTLQYIKPEITYGTVVDAPYHHLISLATLFLLVVVLYMTKYVRGFRTIKGKLQSSLVLLAIGLPLFFAYYAKYNNTAVIMPGRTGKPVVISTGGMEGVKTGGGKFNRSECQGAGLLSSPEVEDICLNIAFKRDLGEGQEYSERAKTRILAAASGRKWDYNDLITIWTAASMAKVKATLAALYVPAVLFTTAGILFLLSLWKGKPEAQKKAAKDKPEAKASLLASAILLLLLSNIPCFAENHALIVANGAYSGGIDPIPYAEADGKALRDFLVSPESHFLQRPEYQAGNVVLLSRGSVAPTPGNVRAQLQNLIANVVPADTVIVFFIGHGFVSQDGNFKKTQLLLASQDARDQGNIDSEEFRDLLEKIPCKCLITCFDVCRDKQPAGLVETSKAEENRIILASLTPDSGVNRIGVYAGPRQFLTIFASRPTENSLGFQMGPEKRRHGVFSYRFLRGLQGEAADSCGVVNTHGLVRYLGNSVYGQVRRELGLTQMPWFSLQGELAYDVPLTRGPIGGEAGGRDFISTPEQINLQQGYEALLAGDEDAALAYFARTFGVAGIGPLAHIESGRILYDRDSAILGQWFFQQPSQDADTRKKQYSDLSMLADQYQNILEGKRNNGSKPDDRVAWAGTVKDHFEAGKQSPMIAAESTMGLANLYYDGGWLNALYLRSFTNAPEDRRRILQTSKRNFEKSIELDYAAVRINPKRALYYEYLATALVQLYFVKEQLREIGADSESMIDGQPRNSTDVLNLAVASANSAADIGYIAADYGTNGLGRPWVYERLRKIQAEWNRREI